MSSDLSVIVCGGNGGGCDGDSEGDGDNGGGSGLGFLQPFDFSISL